MTLTADTARDIEVGASIGSLSRDTGFANWNRYAAVNDEFVPIHMDDEAGRAAGMPGAFGMGNLQISYLHALLRQWAGDSGRIAHLDAQFRKPNTKGVVTATGTVTSVTAGENGTVVAIDIWTENADGGKLANGSAVIEFA